MIITCTVCWQLGAIVPAYWADVIVRDGALVGLRYRCRRHAWCWRPRDE